MIQIENIISELQKKRPVFHSEADYQHALAWEIQCHYPSAAVRLEIHPGRIGPREYIDIWVKYENTVYAIELKYKTGKIDLVHGDEEFHLLNQAAQDIGRYDFIKDIARLERFVGGNPGTIGYAMLLTNDDTYWRASKNLATADAHFRIHESRTLTGERKWSEATGKGTMKGRENPLVLNRSHQIRWVDYSALPKKGPIRSATYSSRLNPGLKISSGDGGRAGQGQTRSFLILVGYSSMSVVSETRNFPSSPSVE